MITVGITGGIGSGKSTIAHLFELMGYPVYYTDERSKWLINNELEIKQKLIDAFGESIYPGYLDRQALASIVFSNKTALEKLNAISHPAVEKDFLNWKIKQNSSVVFKEAAILFESGSYKNLDKIICITAPEIVRIKRVIHRDKTNAEQVQNRIANQWTDQQKLALADFEIQADDNSLAIPQALKILRQIEERHK